MRYLLVVCLLAGVCQAQIHYTSQMVLRPDTLFQYGVSDTTDFADAWWYGAHRVVPDLSPIFVIALRHLNQSHIDTFTVYLECNRYKEHKSGGSWCSLGKIGSFVMDRDRMTIIVPVTLNFYFRYIRAVIECKDVIRSDYSCQIWFYDKYEAK